MTTEKIFVESLERPSNRKYSEYRWETPQENMTTEKIFGSMNINDTQNRVEKLINNFDRLTETTTRLTKIKPGTVQELIKKYETTNLESSSKHIEVSESKLRRKTQREEFIFERHDSDKRLKDSWEAHLNTATISSKISQPCETAASPPTYSDTNNYVNHLPMGFTRELSSSWSSQSEGSSGINLSKHSSVAMGLKDLAIAHIEPDRREDLKDSLADLSFESCSNFTELEASYTLLYSTVLKTLSTQRQIIKTLRQTNPNQTITPPYKSPQKKSIDLNTRTINEELKTKEDDKRATRTGSFREFILKDPIPTAQIRNSSHFWVTSGVFTLDIAIEHYEPNRLFQLSQMYAQHSLENEEMNFGIDDQQFSVHSISTSNNVTKKVPKENNCSQYWFSTGSFLIPFRGKQVTPKQIYDSFRSIFAFVEETVSLRFGIDCYEFSNKGQQNNNHTSPWISNLGHSDIKSQVCAQTLGVSALSQHQKPSHSAESKPNLSKMREKRKILKSGVGLSEEGVINCTEDTDSQNIIGSKEYDEYIKTSRRILTEMENISLHNGFGACSMEQIESFMLYLRRHREFIERVYEDHYIFDQPTTTSCQKLRCRIL